MFLDIQSFAEMLERDEHGSEAAGGASGSTEKSEGKKDGKDQPPPKKKDKGDDNEGMDLDWSSSHFSS